MHKLVLPHLVTNTLIFKNRGVLSGAPLGIFTQKFMENDKIHRKDTHVKMCLCVLKTKCKMMKI
ncbi:conserved hypothetical protein [Acinetobacter baumannii]|nr:conserved hypothetical protein [Acinetobacter baumannii]